ncbi:hypothetical protein [Croceiramulus getboli]|nr:hypothetical protein P8624_08890 [Flavobacteriaceae bacterium YJPT1-3]
MKTTCTLVVMCLSTLMAFAQIRNTNISNRNLSQKVISGVNTQNLQKTNMKELIKMPTTTVDPSKLKVKTYSSWEITPKKLRDKDLYISEFFGEYSPNTLKVVPELKYSGGAYQAWTFLKLKFRAEEGAEYRVKIKLAPGRYFRGHRILAQTNGRNTQKYNVDDARDEVLIVFRGMRNQEVWIGNLFDENSYTAANSLDYIQPLAIQSINIDKIGD